MNLERLFPRASQDFHFLNPPLQPAQPQPDAEKTLGAATKGKEKGMGRVAVRYRIYRVRLQDADNACASTKNITDGLTRCGLICGDSPEQISLTVEQEKVASFNEERTEVKITWPNELSKNARPSCLANNNQKDI